MCWVECVNLRFLTGPDGAVREEGRDGGWRAGVGCREGGGAG